jgi:HxlR-like helix-turn-helix
MAPRYTTSILAGRLAALVQTGILTKRRSATDRRKESYSLTEKGLALIPVLVELANWGVSHDPDVAANPVLSHSFVGSLPGACHCHGHGESGPVTSGGHPGTIVRGRELPVPGGDQDDEHGPAV